MPQYTRGQTRDNLVFVQLSDIFCYGWKTKDLASLSGISSADLSTQLGHMTASVASAIPNRIMVTGCNAPKPARAIMKRPTATVNEAAQISTYIAYDKAATATTNGWSISGYQRGVALTANVAGKRTVSAIAVLSNGVHYLTPMNQTDFDLVKTELGLLAASQISATESKTLARGMSKTRPGIALLQDNGGDLQSTYSTANKTTAATAGFDIKSDERIEFTAYVAPPP